MKDVLCYGGISILVQHKFGTTNNYFLLNYPTNGHALNGHGTRNTRVKGKIYKFYI